MKWTIIEDIEITKFIYYRINCVYVQKKKEKKWKEKEKK